MKMQAKKRTCEGRSFQPHVSTSNWEISKAWQGMKWWKVFLGV